MRSGYAAIHRGGACANDCSRLAVIRASMLVYIVQRICFQSRSRLQEGRRYHLDKCIEVTQHSSPRHIDSTVLHEPSAQHGCPLRVVNMGHQRRSCQNKNVESICTSSYIHNFHVQQIYSVVLFSRSSFSCQFQPPSGTRLIIDDIIAIHQKFFQDGLPNFSVLPRGVRAPARDHA